MEAGAAAAQQDTNNNDGDYGTVDGATITGEHSRQRGQRTGVKPPGDSGGARPSYRGAYSDNNNKQQQQRPSDDQDDSTYGGSDEEGNHDDDDDSVLELDVQNLVAQSAGAIRLNRILRTNSNANDIARRNLAADVAHELRTPLTLLQGGCEEIIDGITEPSIEHFVQMHDDILRLRRLVDDLGTLAEADAALAGANIAVERCDLAAIAVSAADALRPLAEANQQQVNLHLEPAIIDGDPARLAQIVTNLMTNAIKFTPSAGTIDLVVREIPAQRQATLTVSDNGPGIPIDDRPHVFERFYRSESTRLVAGSGIGLAVVAQLVKAHGGTVDLAESTVGTTITVTFPMSPQPVP